MILVHTSVVKFKYQGIFVSPDEIIRLYLSKNIYILEYIMSYYILHGLSIFYSDSYAHVATSPEGEYARF